MVRSFGLLAAVSLALAACTSAVTPGPGTNPPAECGLLANTEADTQALFAAEAAYNIPANAYVTLSDSEALAPNTKARAKAFLTQAYGYLEIARQAKALGNTCDLYAALGQANRLVEDVKAILPQT